MVDVRVTGGTGNLGRHVLPLLAAPDVRLRVLSRHPPDRPGPVRYLAGDTVRGSGVDDAVAGTGVVLHLAGGARGDDVATAHVADAARRAGVAHLVLISTCAPSWPTCCRGPATLATAGR